MIKTIFPYLPQRMKNVLYYRFFLHSSFPEVVHIENTNICNAKCIICPREELTRPQGTMNMALFTYLIDQISREKIVKEVHLHGFGEPLMDKAIIEKIHYAKSKGIKRTYFVTNASLLTPQISRELILSGLDAIKFSFYGVTQETYQKIHRQLDFKTVKQNIVTMFETRLKMDSQKPAIIIQFVPQIENNTEYDTFQQSWRNLIDTNKGDYLMKFYLHNWINSRNYNPRGGQREPCVVPFNGIQILWNGDVSSCVFDFQGKQIMGNAYRNTLKEIWNNTTYLQLRKSHKKKKFKGLCDICDQNILRKDD